MRLATGTALCAAALVAAPASALASSGSCQPSWGSVPSFGANGFDAVDAVSPTDAWAVAKSSTTGAVAHFDGTSWSLVNAPARRYRTTVEARAADDVWTVAKDTATGPNSIEHFDGTSWSTVAMPRGVEVNDLAALSATDVWAVGSVADGTGTRTPYTTHWDGTGWTSLPNVTRGELGTTYASLQSVAALSSDDVWAVGVMAMSNRTLVEHWDGAHWTLADSPAADAAELWDVVAVAPDDLWAVGDAFENDGFHALIEHWNGTSWTTAPAPPSPAGARLHAVAAVASGDVWAVGEAQPVGVSGPQTLIEHWDGATWNVVGPTFADRRLAAVAAAADGSVFAAGGALYELCEVQIGDAGASAAAGGVPLGVPVAWSFASGNRIFDGLGLGLFDSGPRAPGNSFTYAFPAAGAFPVVDATGATSTIKVAPSSSGRMITPAFVAQYTIRWGVAEPPPGSVYDVQLKPALGVYAGFLMNTTVPGLTFTPAELNCPCQVRARLRNAVTGTASGWSTAIRIEA